MNKDLEHLRLLSIFHYVVGGIIALFGCFPLIHLTMGIVFLTMPIPPQSGNFPDQQNPEMIFRLMGAAFVIIPLIIIALFWTLAICTILAGRNLARHQKYTFCLVVAAIICVFMPFGTVLGVFTIIVLLRESVKNIFNHGTANVNSFNDMPPAPPTWK